MTTPYVLAAALSLATASVGAEPRYHLHVKPGAYSGVAFPGEKAEYDIQLKNTSREDREVEMRLRSISDVGEAWDKDWQLEIAAGQEHIEKAVLPTDEIGYWAMKFQVFENGKPVALKQQVSPGQYTVRDYFESGLMVVAKPPSYGKRDPENYFGLIFMEDWEATERIGVKNAMPYPDWGTFEPSPGVYRYHWLDSFFEQAEKHNLEVVLKLNHWPMPHWAMWRAHGGYKGRKEYDTLPADAAMKNWRNYCKAMVERYKGKLMAVEINNEPDLSFWMGPQISIEEGAEVYIKLLKNGYEGIKAADPNVLVAGCGVSGWDSSTGYRFTQLVLEGGKDYLDMFTGHPYADVKYYARGGSTTPEESGMARKLNEALDLLGKHGKKREMWIGELGWGLHFNEPLLSPLSLEYAGGIGQMLIVGRSVPGVNKIFKHTGVTCNEGGHVYGLFRAYSPMYPTPSACAYATCARELHHVDPDGELEIAPAIRSYRFKKRDEERTVFAIWSPGVQIGLVCDAPPSTRAVNSFGRIVGERGELSLSLSEMPTYVSASASDTLALEKALKDASLETEHPITIQNAYLSSNTQMTIDLQNHVNRPLDATIRWLGKNEQQKIDPGTSRVTLDLDEPIALQASLESHVIVEALGKTERVDVPIDLQAIRYLSKMEIDGSLGETRSLVEIDLKTRDDVKPSDPGIPWDGAQDLSVRSWFGWNERALYFAARVTDDIHHAPAWEQGFWNSDSVQIAIDAANDSILGFDREDDREIGFVLGAKGAVAHRTFPEMHKQECQFGIMRQDKVTTYEVVIPWSHIEIDPPVAGRVMAINFVVNENDGKGRACWIGPASGIVEKKQPGLFPEFVLIRE
jgi:hypothetical protein